MTFTAPTVTQFAFDRLLDPVAGAAAAGAGALSLTVDGHLCVLVEDEAWVRMDGALVRSENLTQRPLALRMQGRRVPDVFARMRSVSGQGFAVLSRGDERFEVLTLARDVCFFLEPWLWAMEASLMWDVGMVPGSRGQGGARLIRVSGEGRVAVRAPSKIYALRVAPGEARHVRLESLVGWMGAVVPTVRAGHGAVQGMALCEGEGAVFVCLRPQDVADGRPPGQENEVAPSGPRANAPLGGGGGGGGASSASASSASASSASSGGRAASTRPGAPTYVPPLPIVPLVATSAGASGRAAGKETR